MTALFLLLFLPAFKEKELESNPNKDSLSEQKCLEGHCQFPFVCVGHLCGTFLVLHHSSVQLSPRRYSRNARPPREKHKAVWVLGFLKKSSYISIILVICIQIILLCGAGSGVCRNFMSKCEVNSTRCLLVDTQIH